MLSSSRIVFCKVASPMLRYRNAVTLAGATIPPPPPPPPPPQSPSSSSSSSSSSSFMSSPLSPGTATTVPKPGLLSRFRYVSLAQVEKTEIDMLEKYSEFTENLIGQMTHDTLHPLVEVSQTIRSRDYLREIGTDGKEPDAIDICKSLDNYLSFIRAQDESFKTEPMLVVRSGSETTSNSCDVLQKQQTSLRLRMLLHYIHHLKQAIVEGDLSVSTVRKCAFDRVVDAVLLGSSSERVEQHMHMFANKYGQAQLQDSFYALYNAEVACVRELFLAQTGLKKPEIKRFNAFAKSYLLDTLELNVKSRCVYIWSDPLYTGMKPLPDDHLICADELVASRAKYFNEGGSIGTSLMKSFTGERRLFYSDKREFRENMKYGAVFFVATCLFDWLVCVI